MCHQGPVHSFGPVYSNAIWPCRWNRSEFLSLWSELFWSALWWSANAKKKKQRIWIRKNCAIFDCIVRRPHLHLPAVPYSCPAAWAPCNASCTVAMCSLAIGRDRPLANRCQFHCCLPPNPFGVASFVHIGCDPCESRICKGVTTEKTNTNQYNVSEIVTNKVTEQPRIYALTDGSFINLSRRVVTVFAILLLYDALPAALRHRSLSSIRQHIWSVGPRESSSPVLNPLLFICLLVCTKRLPTSGWLTKPRYSIERKTSAPPTNHKRNGSRN